MKVYLDNAATTKPHPKVIEKMLPFLEEDFGNPSSIHGFGRKVRVAIEEAREVVAEYIGANSSEIYFVSNGTEANNFPIFGIAKTVYNEDSRNELITSKAEHTCVLEAYEELERNGFEPKFLQVDKNSVVDINQIKEAINGNTSMVSLIHVNNETGAVNDLKAISNICRSENRYFHSDVVQSFGKLKIDVDDIGLDSLSASGHKLHGPKGIGMVYARSGTPLTPMIFGGSQERNRRGGTEFVAGIMGFAEAIKIASEESEDNFKVVQDLRDYFTTALKQTKIPGLSINCENSLFPYIISITFDSNIYKNDSEAMLMFLDINGIAASNGAACTSGTLKPSHVIMAMGKSKADANGTIRFSLCAENRVQELDYTVDVIEKMSMKFKKE